MLAGQLQAVQGTVAKEVAQSTFAVKIKVDKPTSISGSAIGTLSTPLSSNSASGSILIALKSIVKSRISSSATGGGGGVGSCSSNEAGSLPCAFVFAISLSFCHCS